MDDEPPWISPIQTGFFPLRWLKQMQYSLDEIDEINC